MTTIANNLALVRAQIAQAATLCRRPLSTIHLLAVSKNHTIDAIQAAIHAGQRAFGENYAQEGVKKIQYWATAGWGQQLQWHFIGRLQRNKSKLIATHFDWVHTVDGLPSAQSLNLQRPPAHSPLQVLIQVNLRGDQTGYGVNLTQVVPLVQQVMMLPNLRLRGLMTIATAPTADPAGQPPCFYLLQSLFHALQTEYPQFDTLSMGMSADLQQAIAAGSTLLRVGTAIFGSRAARRK